MFHAGRPFPEWDHVESKSPSSGFAALTHLPPRGKAVALNASLPLMRREARDASIPLRGREVRDASLPLRGRLEEEHGR